MSVHRPKSPRRKPQLTPKCARGEIAVCTPRHSGLSDLGASLRYSEEYEDAHERLLQFVEESQQHFDMGHCLLAGETIDKAYIEYGKMLALSTEVQQVRFNRQAFASIKLVDNPFEAKCVRRNPEE